MSFPRKRESHLLNHKAHKVLHKAHKVFTQSPQSFFGNWSDDCKSSDQQLR